MYSGSKKCPNVCMIWKDQIGVIHWHNLQPWNFQGKKYDVLASKEKKYHVIKIKTNSVMSQTKWLIIGTFFWVCIILTDYPLLWSVTSSKLSVGTINKVMWLYLYQFDMLSLVTQHLYLFLPPWKPFLLHNTLLSFLSLMRDILLAKYRP